MRTSTATKLLMIPMVAIILGACAAGGAASVQTGAPGPRPSGDEAEYWARVDSARRAYSPADAAFVHGMIAHHAQAVHMSSLAASNTSNPAIQALAARIRIGQEDEIRAMEQWLEERGISHAEAAAHAGPSGHDDHAQHVGPGMLSPDQIARLEQARGSAFDGLFLRFMIEHHRGAIGMVQDLFATDGAANDPFIFQLASEIHAEQVTEISRMERMLLGLEIVPGS
jgi:uncharacterized protein (DUF305 family)